MNENTEDTPFAESSKENGPEPVDEDPFLNGCWEDVTPNLVHEMNKKIAQLTKVVYGLNVRGENLEAQLKISRETEEKTKALNADLQQRVNKFKSKIDVEMGKLRDLENQAKQAQMWKREFENLQRRLEFDGGIVGGLVGFGPLRDELDQARRKETALQYELEQAKHAIANLKNHHDFIMRERDAQQGMEREKIDLEWKSKMNDLEIRSKTKNRMLEEDLLTLKSENESLKNKWDVNEVSNDQVPSIQNQLQTLRTQYEADKKDWTAKLKRKQEEWEKEKRTIMEEKHAIIKKVYAKTEEKEDELQKMKNEWREKEDSYKEQIEDLNTNQELLQKLIDDKEDEFEVRLKTKVVEWKSEWDSAEEGLHEEIRKLKTENVKLQTEVTSMQFNLDSASLNLLTKIQKLEDELTDKNNELELRTKNFKVRLGMVENESRQYLQERVDLERHLDDERERFKSKLKIQEEINNKYKHDFRSQLEQATDSEKNLKEINKYLEEEIEALKNSKQEVIRKGKEAEREMLERMEYEIKISEAKIKQKTERIWLEKLKKSEETANYDLQKMHEARKRRESSFRQEIEVAQISAEEAKSISEELEQKLKLARTAESEKSKTIETLNIQLEEMKRNDERRIMQQSKELMELEQRYQGQIDDLSLKLTTKQREVRDLLEANSGLQQKTFNNEDEDFKNATEDLKKQLKSKENMIERIKVELEYSKSEHEISKMKIQRLEEEVKKSKEMTLNLQEENRNKAEETGSLLELKNRISVLEAELRRSEGVRKDMEENLNIVETEREEELKIAQDALDEAAEEREMLISTFEKELETLNSTNTGREQQLLEDFEFKLREMEKEHKTKMDEKERQVEARINAVRSVVESEMADSLTKVAEDRRIADEKLAEVGHLRSYEAEVIQLRGVTHEFQKALRASAREMENLKVKERLLEEEIRSLKTGAQSRQSTLCRTKNHSDEEEARQKLEKALSEINSQWEDKLRNECSRLKTELDQLHSEEKHLAVESMKVQKEQQIQTMKKNLEKTQEELTKKISSLKDDLAEKNAFSHKELEALRTSTDREIWDLRMKMQKMSEASLDKQQQIEDKYKEEIERIRIEYSDKMSDLQYRFDDYKLRESDDKTNMVKEHREQMRHLEEQHKQSMARLREELDSERFQAIEEVRVILKQNHKITEIALQMKLDEVLAKLSQSQGETENLRISLSNKDSEIQKLQHENETLRENPETEMNENQNSSSNLSPSHTSDLNSSQFSLVSSSDSHDSKNSAEQFYVPEGNFVNEAPTLPGGALLETPSFAGGSSLETQEETSSKSSGLLGKVFGGSWFAPSKSKEVAKKGSKKTGGS